MEKYKICPVCHTHNSPTVLECVECGNDLMGIRVVDDSYTEQKAESDTTETAKEQNNLLVRICECGQENELSARKCVSCGEDISDITPSQRRSQGKDDNYYISSIDGESTLSFICPSEHIIGRECELSEYLQEKYFVSRKHAVFTVTSEGCFIQNLSKSNGTYVNNEKIDDGVAYKLCVGDEIGLGGFINQNGRQDAAAYFLLEKEQ